MEMEEERVGGRLAMAVAGEEEAYREAVIW